MITYQVGQPVRYSQPESGEESLTFVVLEDNGDRVLIESRDFPDARIPPTEVVAKDQIAAIVPPYETRKALREATLKVGREA